MRFVVCGSVSEFFGSGVAATVVELADVSSGCGGFAFVVTEVSVFSFASRDSLSSVFTPVFSSADCSELVFVRRSGWCCERVEDLGSASSVSNSSSYRDR